MTITVNGETIDFTLENEQTAGEVLKALSSWLGESGLSVAQIKMGGQVVLAADQSWQQHPVSEVDSLSVEALDHRESYIRQLETARNFFILLENALQDEDTERLDELKSAYPDLKTILLQFADSGINPEMLPADDFQAKDPEQIRQTSDMALMLEKLYREAADPAAEVRSAALALAQTADALGDVAVSLQTGKDKEAMDTIIRMTDLFQHLIRALGWSGGSHQELIGEFNQLLSELEEGLESGDTVLIGDLLEYEFKPRLISLPETLKTGSEA